MKRGSDGRDGRSPKRRGGHSARPTSAPGRDDDSDDGRHGRGGRGGGGRSQGRIIFYDKQKGYGFIQSPDVDSDVFFGSRGLPRELQDLHPDDMKGREVSFELGFKDDGKPRADHIESRGRGGGGDRGGGGHRSGGNIVVGKVVRYEEAKGYGFIAPESGGEDVFFLRGELPPEMSHCTRKSELLDVPFEFEVYENDKGKLRARRLALLHRGGGGGPRVGGGGGGGEAGRIVIGRILRYDRGRGYGFISSPQEPEDIFFLPSALPPDLHERVQHEDLSHIEVEIELGYKEGKPRANRVMHLQMGPPGPIWGPAGCGSGGPRVGGPFGTGLVISFDSGKGFGFIKPDQPGEDIFVLRSELPPEIREESPKAIIDQRVEFEVKQMPDGKLRAQRCRLIPNMPPMMGGPPMPPFMPPLPPGSRPGRITRFDRVKGYGFIEIPGEKDVFFLPSALPKELRDGNEPLDGMEIAFEFYINEEGKPRGRNITRLMLPPPPPPHMMAGMPPPPVMANMMAAMMGMPPPMMGPMGPMGMPPPMGPMGPGMVPGMGPMDHAPPRFRPGQVLSGMIVRFTPNKGYGFLAPDDFDEDIFFLRSELPSDIREAQSKDDVVNRRVEFEVRTMPDGKLRALRLKMLADQNSGRRRRDDQPAPALDPSLIDEMAEFLSDQGGGVDFGRFCSRFPKVKKLQLEEHFDIFSLERGQRIELPPGHPGRRDDGDVRDEAADLDEVEAAARRGAGDDGIAEETDEVRPAQDDDAPDEPAIPPGPSCQPLGWIRSYDPAKGFGFVRVEGMEEDIFFPRTALPETFHAKQRGQMPELTGVEVSVELGPNGDRGPRAQRLNLLLKWHIGDGCWLLRRR